MRLIINLYYDFLMWLEDITCAMTSAVNNHRRAIDEKYWDKYLKKEAK